MFIGGSIHATNYLWIGGSGNWSDTLHWQSEDGGIPGTDDIAIFNSLSFPSNGQTVTIDIAASCFTLDFSLVNNNPEFAGNQPLSIYGGFELTDKISWNFGGSLNFETTLANQEIYSNGNILSSEINFNGSGSWQLQSDLLTTSSINLNNGLLQADAYLIQCTSFYALSSNEKSLDLSNSTLEVTSTNGSWEVDGSFNLIKTNSIIRLINPDLNSQFTFKGGGIEYEKVLLSNNTQIFGSNTFYRLRLAPGAIYGFEGGKTQTFSGLLVARGCSSIIEIQSFGTNNAIFSKNNGDIQISFVSLHGITAQMGSGNQMNAYYSIDDGNNNNCNILSTSREMHWVNGTGIWSDTSQWNSPDVGPDGDCIPLPFDNLFFDENSFLEQDTVIVDIPDIACNDMSWSGTDIPVFSNLPSGGSLSIFGSLYFKPDMKNQFSGTTYFLDSLGNQNIQTANIPFNGDVVFWGSGGWKVTDSLKISGNVVYFEGTLDIFGNYMSCRTFHSDSAFLRKLTFGDTQIKIQSANPAPAWSLNSTDLEFDAGTSEIGLKANGSRMTNYEGDTIFYHDVIFEGTVSTAYLKTESSIHAKFRKLEFFSNGRVYGENTIDTLALHPGNNLSLPAGLTQTIRKAIYPSGICTGPVLINSSTIGQQALLAATMDTLKLNYSAIQDIATVGDSVFWALNSNDLGNNSGWDTIQETAPGNLYWVGGSGNWSDPDHWALSSGDLGGACIPTPMDNVYFDINSFDDTDQLVMIDQNNVFMRDMNWTGADFIPTLDGNYAGASMRIYSSLTMIPEMQFEYPAFITFESRDTNKTIQTAGIPFHNVNNNIYFNGIGGKWTLLNALDIGLSIADQNSIYYYYGHLKTDNYPVSCFNFYSTSSGERTLELDSSFVHVMNNWNVRGVNLSISPNTSLIQIDSGYFKHFYGNTFYYNDLLMNSDDIAQVVELSQADSLIFNTIKIIPEGIVTGASSTVITNDMSFMQGGKVNTSFSSSNSVFILDSLTFSGIGEIYGNDTVTALLFDSTGLIHGNGYYTYNHFGQDGEIKGTNLFDTLICTAGYNYVLEEGSIQTITDSLYLKGNNCQFVYLSSSGINPAEIHKDTATVFGEFIKMQGINATGGALFDAGYFSEDISGSNTGWIFHDFPDKYLLGNDTSFQAGNAIELCASNFNGNAGTTYEWINLATGEIIGTDSCIILDDVGEIMLNVIYDDGPGCIKSDIIELFCMLGNTYTQGDISCNGFEDGFVEMNLNGQTDPVDYNWYDESNNLIATTKNLYDQPAGAYAYEFEDASGCLAAGAVQLEQPESLSIDFDFTPTCNGSENGTIQLFPEGGTTPYFMIWEDGSTLTERENLPPGIYSVSFTDANDCPAINNEIEIIELDALSFSLVGEDLNCFEDSTGLIVATNIQGGSGTYEDFYWTYGGQPFSIEQNIDSLLTGIYTLIITDDNSCTASSQIVINQPPELNSNLSAYIDDNELGFVDLTVEGGIPPYDYLWDDGSSGTQIGPLTGGDYFVSITDAHGCVKQAAIFVEVGFKIYAPTAFSPNGDQVNDTFHLLSVGNDHKHFKLSIYNRYGEEIFMSIDENEGWNGRFKNIGDELPIEVYTWIAEIAYKSGEHIVEKGNVTLLR